MAEIKVYFPRDGASYHSNTVAATGRYKRPERVRGMLSSLADASTYTGKLHVMQDKYWALFFEDVEVNQKYALHIFDYLEPETQVNLSIKVLPAIGASRMRIIFPAAGEILTDRTVPVVGITGAPQVTSVKIAHVGQVDLLPAEPLPIIPVAKSWTATITIPSEYPCPGDSPDYTVLAEDSLGAPFPSNGDIKLDQTIFCPAMAKGESKKKKQRKQKKKKPKSAKKK
jgi:hypothetical protein